MYMYMYVQYVTFLTGCVVLITNLVDFALVGDEKLAADITLFIM